MQSVTTTSARTGMKAGEAPADPLAIESTSSVRTLDCRGIPGFDGHELVVCFTDAGSGLRTFIAIHSMSLGPALGGCRMWPYATEEEALVNALRLSQGMSCKHAVAGVACDV